MTVGFEKVNKYTLEMFPDYVPKKADTVILSGLALSGFMQVVKYELDPT